MRSNNVILVIVLVVLSLSNAFEFTNLAEVKELRSSAFGNNLIETISLSLASQGNVKEVSDLLENLLFQLNKDQKEATEKWNVERARLDDKISKLEKEIKEISERIAKNEAAKADFEAKIRKAISNLAQYAHQIDSNTATIKELDAKRAADAEEFKSSESEHNAVANAIDEVIKELRTLVGSISGKGKFSHIEATDFEKRDAAAMKAKFLEITQDDEEATMLAELATNADQNALNNLINLLVSLRQSTRKSLNDDIAHEKQSIDTYTSTRANLVKDNESLAKLVIKQKANKKDYEEKVAALVVEIARDRALKASKEKELASTIKERAEKLARYNYEKAEREHEGEVIRKLQHIVTERLSKMNQFLKAKTGAF